jgi:hypothetical protein
VRGQIERKRTIGMAKHTGNDNIKMDLKEIGWKGVDCFNLTGDIDQWWALVSMVMNCWVP